MKQEREGEMNMEQMLKVRIKEEGVRGEEEGRERVAKTEWVRDVSREIDSMEGKQEKRGERQQHRKKGRKKVSAPIPPFVNLLPALQLLSITG